jgi:hypothetical protein
MMATITSIVPLIVVAMDKSGMVWQLESLVQPRSVQRFCVARRSIQTATMASKSLVVSITGKKFSNALW